MRCTIKKVSGKFAYQETFLWYNIRRKPCMSKKRSGLRMQHGESMHTAARRKLTSMNKVVQNATTFYIILNGDVGV